ncbi:hypothetical protein JTB14_018794, partial [Gonioctena quinquepunctata]
APAVHNSDTDDASSPPAEEVQIVPQEDRYAPIVDQSIVRPLSRETGNFRPLSRETGIDTTLPENKTDLSLQSETAVRPEVELPAELRKRRRRCRMSAYDNIEIVPENACTSLRHDVTPVNPSVARVAILHRREDPEMAARRSFCKNHYISNDDNYTDNYQDSQNVGAESYTAIRNINQTLPIIHDPYNFKYSETQPNRYENFQDFPIDQSIDPTSELQAQVQALNISDNINPDLNFPEHMFL